MTFSVPSRAASSLSAFSACARAALASAVAVVLPTECAGCGAADHPVCPVCAATLALPREGERRPRAVELSVDADRAPPLRVWAAAPYGGVLKSALAALKESGRTDLVGILGAVLQGPIQDAATVLAPLLPAGARLELTVAPSSRAAFRQRGYHPVDMLAKGARLSHPVVRTVQVARATADQAGLGIAARRANLDGSLRVRRKVSGRLAGRHFLIVDDVVTTGSTLLECRRALRLEGAVVWGAATLAFAEKQVGMSAVRRTSEREEHIL